MFDIKNLNDDYFGKLDSQEILDIKGLTTEEKVQCFKYFLTSDVITNISVIANLFVLINGATDIEEENDDPKVFFNDLMEYVDIKLDTKDEIDSFNIRLLEYYLGVVEGLDIKLDELKVHIPNTHFNILHLVTPNLLSKLTLKYLSRINVSNVKPAHCADRIYNKINNPTSLVTDFLYSIINEVKVNADSF